MTVQTEGKAKWHKGHRQRVIERIGKESTQSMRDYELIEALLFFSTPQRDTKGIAKELLALSGNSLWTLFTMESAKRAGVKFVAEKTNKLLTIVRETATRMAQAQDHHQQLLMDSLEAIVTYCRHNMTADGNQFFLVLYVDHKNRLITHERMEHKKTRNHCALLRHVVKQSFIYDGTAVVLARYDTAQHIVPTEHDIAMMHAITEPLREMAIGCVDYVIVNHQGHYSWNHSVNIKMQDQAVLMENTAHDDSDLYEWHDDDDNEEMPLAIDHPTTASEEALLHALLFLVTKSSAAEEMARAMLSSFNGSLAHMVYASTQERVARGITHARINVLLNLIGELSRRMAHEQMKSHGHSLMSGFDELIQYCRANIGHKRTECFHVLYLDHKKRLITDAMLAQGEATKVSFSLRDLTKQALIHDARGLVMVHNHPSGQAKPSRDDVHVTQKIRKKLQLLGIVLLDHIIITRKDYYSFEQDGLL